MEQKITVTFNGVSVPYLIKRNPSTGDVEEGGIIPLFDDDDEDYEIMVLEQAFMDVDEHLFQLLFDTDINKEITYPILYLDMYGNKKEIKLSYKITEINSN